MAKADETNVQIEATNAKVDKTSAEVTKLRQEFSDEVTKVKDQVTAVIEDVETLKANMDTIREDTKKTKDEIMLYVHEKISEKLGEVTAKRRSGEIAQEQQLKAPEVPMIQEIPSPAPTYQQPIKEGSQPLTIEGETYLENSPEEELSLIHI